VRKHTIQRVGCIFFLLPLIDHDARDIVDCMFLEHRLCSQSTECSTRM
jgi:hypothetical protein